MNPHITVSAPQPYIVHNVQTKAISGTNDFFIKAIKVIFSPFLNESIISAATVNKYTGKYDNVASIVIKVNDDTILFW